MASHIHYPLKIKPTRTDDINAALEMVIDLAFQGATDRYDNPTRYRREMAAIKLVQETFQRGDAR